MVDVFPVGDDHNAQFTGGVDLALRPNTDVCFSRPQIETTDVVADKFPAPARDSNT